MSLKKVILKLDLHDDKDKQRAMKVVSKIPRIDSIAMDMKDMKLTVIGDVDPVNIVNKLRKYWKTEIFQVGVWPEKKKDDDKKGDQNKEKEGGKKGGGGDNKQTKENEVIYNPNYLMPYYPHVVNYPQHVTTHYPPPNYYAHAVHEENPNGCVIC